jgi:hypothetical protein
MLAQFVAWVLALWVGFALVYLPSVDQLAYAPSVRFGERDLAEALYVSATAPTTVGFGTSSRRLMDCGWSPSWRRPAAWR